MVPTVEVLENKIKSLNQKNVTRKLHILIFRFH